jgi:hypothetical protein
MESQIQSIEPGREILSIRRFWRRSEGDEWAPGKGVTFHWEDIRPIIEGLEKMYEDYTPTNPTNTPDQDY